MAKPFSEVVNIQPATFSTGAAQFQTSLAQGLDAFAAQQAGAAAQKTIAESSAQGKAAGVEQQKAGGKLELKEETFIGGISQKAFNISAREGYLKSLDNDNIEQITNISNENAGNLAGFNDAVNAYSKGVMESVDPASRSAVALSIDSMVSRFRPKIQAAQAKAVVDQANQDQAINATERSRLAQSSSFEGDVEQAGINLAFSIDSINNRTDLDDEQKSIRIRNVQLEEREAHFSGELSRTFDSEGPQAAMDQLDGLKMPKGFTPDEWDKFVSQEQTKVNRKVQRQKRDLKAVTEAAKIEAKTARGLLFLDPAIPADPSDSEDREDVNLAYEQISQDWQGLPAQDQINNTVEFTENTGLVPDQIISNVNAAMRSGTTEQVGLMSDYLSRVQESSPASLKDIPQESRAISLQVSDAIRAGIDGDVALEQARKNTFGLTDTEKDTIRNQTQAVSKDLTGNLQTMANQDLDQGGFDTGIFSFVPDVPAAMDGDFRNSFGRFMNMTGGDVEQSQKLAFQATKSVWSVTETGGPKRFMKYAPEVMYNIPGINSNWIEDQFNEEMELAGAEGAIIAIDNSVARESRPSYPVLVQDENGILQPMRDENNALMRYKPDYKSTEDYKELIGEPGRKLESAKKQREINLNRRANQIRRGIQVRVLGNQFIPFNERADFLQSEAGRSEIELAITNMQAADKINALEAQEARNAFDL